MCIRDRCRPTYVLLAYWIIIHPKKFVSIQLASDYPAFEIKNKTKMYEMCIRDRYNTNDNLLPAVRIRCECTRHVMHAYACAQIGAG